MAKAKYTYLYNGNVVRNSNHVYEYGLVNHYDAIIACSGTEAGALKVKTRELNFLKRQLEYCKKHKKQTEFIKGYETDIANTEKWHTIKLERKEN